MTALSTRPTTRSRDGLLDLLRCVSIVRVVGVHVLGRMRLWFWPAPTYVMPGMPIVFFVSGSLAHRSLRIRSDGTSIRSHWTGAAAIRLVVNTPAADDGRSARITARSRFPDALIPAFTEPAR